MAEQFRQADVSGVKELSKIFEGKEFCVINAPRELSKQEIERKIVEVKFAQLNTSPPLSFSLSQYLYCHCLIIERWYVCAKSRTRYFLCVGE